MNKFSRCILAAAPALLLLWPDAAWQPAARAQGAAASPSPKPRRARQGQSSQAGAVAARAATTPKPAPSPAADVETPAPATKTPKAPKGGEGDGADAPTQDTEIIAIDGATFNSKDRTAVFNGDVSVVDPKFELHCDKLTVFLRKTAAKPKDPNAAASGGGAAAATTPAPLAAASPAVSPAAGGEGDSPENSGGIDHAIAEGHVFMKQERPATTPGGETKIAIARADHAYIDNNKGQMTLTGTPSVEQNGNTHVSLAPTTVMVLSKDNSLSTKGPSRTLIKQRKGMDDFGGPSVPSPAAKPKP